MAQTKLEREVTENGVRLDELDRRLNSETQAIRADLEQHATSAATSRDQATTRMHEVEKELQSLRERDLARERALTELKALVEKWENRVWALILLSIGTLLTAVFGLLLAIAKK